MTATYTVEEVCQRLGITESQLHEYEEMHLIRDVPLLSGNQRYYDEETVNRIEHAIKMKELLGSSLPEILSVLEAEEDLERLKASYREKATEEERRSVIADVTTLLQSQVHRIDDRIDKLIKLRENFDRKLMRIREMNLPSDQPHSEIADGQAEQR
ncbi:MerR family transcriptional regulator [Paenibacillus sp. CC-CFT747]|nr:MerR family transcriptional regulator [Paenibacillus sp. CC-CFT747]